MAATTYETQFILGAKYTGGPAFEKFDRQLRKIEKDVERFERAAVRAQRKTAAAVAASNAKLAKFGRTVFTGVFGGVTAAGAVIGTVNAIKRLGNAAWDAAAGVVHAKESAEALIQTYGFSAEQAKKWEEQFYALARAHEQTGHDAELMLDVMARVKKTMTGAGVMKNIDMLEDLVTAFSEASGPTAESAAKAADAYNQAIKRARGPLLDKLALTDRERKDLKKMSEVERQVFLDAKIHQKFYGATARWRKTESGKLAVGLRDIENVLEDLGEASVGNRGRIGELLSSIAEQTSKIAKTELGPWFGKKIQEALDYLDKNLPRLISDFKLWYDRMAPIVEVLQKIGKAWWDTFTKPMLDTIGWVLDKFKEFYPTLSEQWDKSVADTQKQMDALYKYLSTGLEDSIADTKRQWLTFLTWYETYISGPLKKAYEAIRPYLPRQGTPEENRANEEMWDRSYRQYQGTAEEIKNAMDYAPGIGPVPKAAAEASVGGPGAKGVLSAERARFAMELQDPNVMRLLMASTAAEVGTQGAAAEQAYMESVMNRGASRNMTLKQTLLDPHYYPKATKQKLGRTIAGMKAEHYRNMAKTVLGGSNLSNWSTGNESGSVTSGGAGGVNAAYRAGGERFVRELGDRKWIARQMRRAEENQKATEKATETIKKATPAAAGSEWKYPTREEELRNEGRGPNWGQMTSSLNRRTGIPSSINNNVTAPATVNIHGINAGNIPQLASSVQSALRSRDREVLEMLNSARDYQDRNGYV